MPIGKYLKTEEHKRKLGEALKGHHVCDITKEKLRKAHLGKIQTAETKRKISKAVKGENNGSYIDGRSQNPKARKMLNGRPYSHVVYCSQPIGFYRVPKGLIIHHLDLNPENDNLKNLVMIPDREHRILHNRIVKEIRLRLGYK